MLKKSIIHRDIKPENILISNLFELKLIDFRIAAEIGVRDMIKVREAGTGLYYPPENVRDTDRTDTELMEEQENSDDSITVNRTISSKFDIWSYGLILSELFGCEQPWGKGNYNNIIQCLVMRKRYPIPSSIDNIIIKIIIEGCTRYHQEDRFSFEDIIKLLNILLIEKFTE